MNSRSEAPQDWDLHQLFFNALLVSRSSRTAGCTTGATQARHLGSRLDSARPLEIGRDRVVVRRHATLHPGREDGGTPHCQGRPTPAGGSQSAAAAVTGSLASRSSTSRGVGGEDEVDVASAAAGALRGPRVESRGCIGRGVGSQLQQARARKRRGGWQSGPCGLACRFTSASSPHMPPRPCFVTRCPRPLTCTSTRAARSTSTAASPGPSFMSPKRSCTSCSGDPAAAPAAASRMRARTSAAPLRRASGDSWSRCVLNTRMRHPSSPESTSTSAVAEAAAAVPAAGGCRSGTDSAMRGRCAPHATEPGTPGESDSQKAAGGPAGTSEARLKSTAQPSPASRPSSRPMKTPPQGPSTSSLPPSTGLPPLSKRRSSRYCQWRAS